MGKRRNKKEQNKNPRKCPKCGSRLEPEFHFCPFCGLQLKEGMRNAVDTEKPVYGENTASERDVDEAPDEFGDAFDLLKEIQAAPADEIDPEPDFQDAPVLNVETMLRQAEEL